VSVLFVIWGWSPGGATGSLPQAATNANAAKAMARYEIEVMMRMRNSGVECERH
jgi:hypothetical protein